ncbi:MAG: hypothetical protein P4L46_05995 [Fimbriimonas sp.]|nr:hypothetical protein [Fimbriimonas sp.]
MSVTSRTDPAGFQIFTLSAGDQEVLVSAFGGQILSWSKGGKPCIFENHEHAIVDGKTPYRGGAPICFAFFGKGSLLPLGTTLSGQHGEARVTVWDSVIDEAQNAVVLTTRQPSAEGYGPTEFSCKLVYALAEDLSIQATIRNVGEKESPFQFAVHTYWATAEPSAASVKGMGNRYLDNLLGLTEQRETDSSEPHPIPFDRVYLDAESDMELRLKEHTIGISTMGCTGAVLWNPGKDHTVKDLGSPDFICLESGLITPSKTLFPSEEHVIQVTYRAQPI